jgi:hypothetical protein
MIFISHSTANDGFVDKLAEDLHIRGIQTWVDHRDMPAGSRWVAQLETALMESDVMLLVLSNVAIASSYVESEWHTFFNMGRKIIPLIVDDCVPPLFLRTFHQIDFRDMRRFDEQVEALLQVLPDYLDRTARSHPTKMLNQSPQSNTTTEQMGLNERDIMALAHDLIDQKALTLRADTIQFILPIDEIILQYPLMDEMLIGRIHRSAQFQPDIDLSSYSHSWMISRRHATIRRKGTMLYLQDNQSSNGTFIGDVALSPMVAYPIENYSLIYLSHHFPVLIRYQFK